MKSVLVIAVTFLSLCAQAYPVICTGKNTKNREISLKIEKSRKPSDYYLVHIFYQIFDKGAPILGAQYSNLEIGADMITDQPRIDFPNGEIFQFNGTQDLEGTTPFNVSLSRLDGYGEFQKNQILTCVPQ